MTRFARNLLVLVVLVAAVGVFAVAGPASAATVRPAVHAVYVAPCTPNGHDGTVTHGHAVMWSYRQWHTCPTGPVTHAVTGDPTNRWWYPARVYGHIWF